MIFLKHFKCLSRKEDGSLGKSSLFRRVVEFEKFLNFHIFSYFKFFDHSKTDDDPDNYYLEREWRVVGNVQFDSVDVQTVFFPSEYSKLFRENIPEYIGQIIFTD